MSAFQRLQFQLSRDSAYQDVGEIEGSKVDVAVRVVYRGKGRDMRERSCELASDAMVALSGVVTVGACHLWLASTRAAPVGR